MQFPRETYDNRFFQEAGFLRKQCPSGPFFWTLNPDIVYSGIQPDVTYTFIGKQLFDGAYTLRELRERSVRWFASQGHAPMGSYPVLASLWRNDLLFTSASVCDFQPHVIGRQLLPQANPLVVPQKCVRLNDLENIGRSGRHLSSFTMLGHHAFNFEGEPEIYWIDRTVELCHRFFTEELKVDGMRLTYVESVWAGGGNAGPCVEVICEGIEIATLVFMCLQEDPHGEYDIKGIRYAPMPTRVVDTGYGLERIVWASQGTANIYTAVSPDFLKRLQEVTGFALKGELIDAYFTKMSSQDIETPLQYEKVQAQIARELGVDVKTLVREVRPAETLFTLCDFTRTLLLMLNDHVLPSNKDAGYLVRHLAKRILTMVAEEKIALSATEILGLQFDAMVGDFPELEGKKETALDILRVEAERHDATLARGRAQLVKEIQQLQKKGAKSFPEDKIFFYYDTLGLPLPYIREVVEQESTMTLDVSDDFWAKFFNKNAELGGQEAKASFPQVSGGKTRRLYYEDPYAAQADGVVRHAGDGWVALDQTIFYPEGGGQPGDRGVISVDGSRFEVVDTVAHGGVVYHKLAQDAPADLVGARVKLEIDWARRYQLMKAHSVTHLLNATLKKVLGFHVRQMGAQKGTDATRFDIAHYRNIEPDQVAEIEGRVNEAIFGGAPISTEVMRRGAAEDKYGFFIYQGGFVPFDELRIVTIAGIDTEACAGTHLKDIQEVSLFKMLGASQIQNNVYRLRYTVSGEALGQFHEAEKILHQVQETLGTAREVTASKIVKLFDEVKDQSKLLGDYEETILRLESQAARAQEAGKPALYFFKSAVPKDRAMRHLIRMARTGENQVYFTVFKDGALMMRSKDLKNLDLAAAAAKFDKLEVLNSGNDMIVFGGQVEPGAAWDIARKLV